MQVAVIPADPDEPIRFEDIEISLDAVQERVGGYIEAVRLGQDEMTMYVNEEGKRRALPHNVRATLLAHGVEAISPADWIAGTAVLTGGMDDEGYDTALTEEQMREVRAFGEDYLEALAVFHPPHQAARRNRGRRLLGRRRRRPLVFQCTATIAGYARNECYVVAKDGCTWHRDASQVRATGQTMPADWHRRTPANTARKETAS